MPPCSGRIGSLTRVGGLLGLQALAVDVEASTQEAQAGEDTDDYAHDAAGGARSRGRGGDGRVDRQGAVRRRRGGGIQHLMQQQQATSNKQQAAAWMG